MKLSDMLVPTYVQMLKALAGWLAKAEERSETLAPARLAANMFPLSTQIRFACVQAYEGIYRLRGEELPDAVQVLLDEGRAAADRPGSLADAITRIDETVAAVTALATTMPDIDPQAPIVHALPMGMIFDLTAEQYVRDWALPQFYFHVMTAYAILRSEGVDLGKADYVAHMFAYLRPGTMPAR